MTLSALLVILAVVALVAAPVLATVTFSRDRAESERQAEIVEATPVVYEREMAKMRYRHPEIIKASRLDHHDSYLWINAGLWLVGLGVILTPASNSNVAALSLLIQHLLGLAMLVGSSTSLIGALLGVRIGPITVRPSIADNLFSDILGDDVRIPYIMAWFGLFSIAVSMWFYAVTTTLAAKSRVLGTLGGGLSLAIGCMCVTLSIRFLIRLRRYSKARGDLMTELDERIDAQS